MYDELEIDYLFYFYFFNVNKHFQDPMKEIKCPTNNFAASQAKIIIWAVKEGETGFGARSHIYLVFDLRVYAHLTIRVRAHLLNLE